MHPTTLDPVNNPTNELIHLGAMSRDDFETLMQRLPDREVRRLCFAMRVNPHQLDSLTDLHTACQRLHAAWQQDGQQAAA